MYIIFVSHTSTELAKLRQRNRGWHGRWKPLHLVHLVHPRQAACSRRSHFPLDVGAPADCFIHLTSVSVVGCITSIFTSVFPVVLQ